MVARFIVIFLESDKGDEEGRFYLNKLDLQEEMGASFHIIAPEQSGFHEKVVG